MQKEQGNSIEMDKRNVCNPAERATALVLIIVGILGYYFAMEMTSDTFYSPSVIPKLTSVCIAIFSLAALFATRKKKAAPQNMRETISFLFPKDVLVILFLLMVYSVALPLVGFNIASVIFLCVSMMYLQKGRHKLRAVIISIVAVAVLFLVFRYLFLVILP